MLQLPNKESWLQNYFKRNTAVDKWIHKTFTWYLAGTKHPAILDSLRPLTFYCWPSLLQLLQVPPSMATVPKAAFLPTMEPAAQQLSALGWPIAFQVQCVSSQSRCLPQTWSISSISRLTPTLEPLIHKLEISIDGSFAPCYHILHNSCTMDT